MSVLGDTAAGEIWTHKLLQFRLQLEAEAAQPLATVEANAALVLSDLCRFLGLDERQHDDVLGPLGVDYVQHTLDVRMSAMLGGTRN